MFMFQTASSGFLLVYMYALAVLQVKGQSARASMTTVTLATVSRYVDNVTTVNNASSPNTTISNSTSSGLLTALDAESTSRMIILIVVSLLVVAAAVAILVMWRRSRRGLPGRPNGQVPRPGPAETEDLSTVLQNPGFISSSRGEMTEQLSGLPIRLADDDPDDSTVYHELRKPSPSPNEELMDEFYPIEIPEDDRG
ncbi:uncharacterized protein LOC144923889 [Branchiostoma floridae x Branchiostoma belcheri]